MTVPFIPYLGLKVVAMGYLVINIIVFLISFVYHMDSMAFRLSPANFILLSKGSGLLALGFWSSYFYELNVMRIMLNILILLMMYIWLLKQPEKEFAKSYIRQKAMILLKRSENIK